MHDNSQTQEIENIQCPLCPIADSATFNTTTFNAKKMCLAQSMPATPSLYHEDKFRTYWHCPCCDLVFVPAKYHLSTTAQKAIYDQHNNHPDDPGYQRFLSRLTDALLPKLTPGARGLDYGCGPGPALAQLMRAKHCHLHLYDPIYYPNEGQLSVQYDFITATEVVEHFCDTGPELTQLWAQLKPGGWLGIMTKRVTHPQAFKTWHYIRDLTHVSFFSDATFSWLAKLWQAKLILPAKDVALLQKPV